MAWGTTKKIFGVCGNFKFEFVNLTNVKATQSLIKPVRMNRIHFVSTTNLTDNTDHLAGQTLNWSGTADTNVTNEIKDTSETFDPEIDGAQAHNTTDNRTAFVTYKDADELYCHKGGLADAVYDLCPDGNEVYSITSERIVEVTAQTADDSGTLLIIGG